MTTSDGTAPSPYFPDPGANPHLQPTTQDGDRQEVYRGEVFGRVHKDSTRTVRSIALTIVVLGALALPGKIPPLSSLFCLLLAVHWVDRFRDSRRLLWLTRGMVLAALATVVSDLANQDISAATLASGARFLVIAAACLVSVQLEQRVPNIAVQLLVGFACSSTLPEIASGESTQAVGLMGYWKYILGVPLTLIFLALADSRSSRGRNSVFYQVVIVGLAIYGVISGARFLGAVTLAAVMLASFRPVWTRTTAGKALAGGILLGALFLGTQVYGALAANGDLGYHQQQKWTEDQAATGGPLVGGRPELLVSITAVQASPLFGFGTDLRLPSAVQSKALERLAEFGIPMAPDAAQYYFPSGSAYLHSKLPAEWAAHGSFAFAGLALLPLLFLKNIPLFYGSPKKNRLPIFLTLYMTWDVLFSPWTTGSATLLGLSAAVIFTTGLAESAG